MILLLSDRFHPSLHRVSIATVDEPKNERKNKPPLKGWDLYLEDSPEQSQRFPIIRLLCLRGFVHHAKNLYDVVTLADALVGGIDSQRHRLEENLRMFRELRTLMRVREGDCMYTLPYVIQYHKRDLSDIVSIKSLDRTFNEDHVPAFEAVARQGRWVIETVTPLVHSLIPALVEEGHV